MAGVLQYFKHGMMDEFQGVHDSRYDVTLSKPYRIVYEICKYFAVQV
jgi:hypothetical protein